MTTDPEQPSTQRHKDADWLDPNDEAFIDGIDKTLDERAAIDEDLEKVYESVPRYENPIKIEKNFALLYETLSDEDKEDFLLELERRYLLEDEPDPQKGAIKSFLDSHKRIIDSHDKDFTS